MAGGEELNRHTIKNLEQADALLFDRVIYELTEAAFRPQTVAGQELGAVEPFAQAINGQKIRCVERPAAR